MTVLAVSRVVIHTPVSQLRMVPNFIFDESALTSIPALQGSPGASVMSGTKASVCRAVQGQATGWASGVGATQC